MRTHELKTWPSPFQDVWDGRKLHEVRVDDRGYAVGDVLVLNEYDPSRASLGALIPRGFTGRKIFAKVTYISYGGTWGLPPNLCVMSIIATERRS